MSLNQAVVGSLLYLTQVSRHDMLLRSQSSHMMACSKPAKVHKECSQARIPLYLKGSSDLPTMYKKEHIRMHAYTDASFAANPDKRKSTPSFLIFMGGRAN